MDIASMEAPRLSMVLAKYWRKETTKNAPVCGIVWNKQWKAECL